MLDEVNPEMFRSLNEIREYWWELMEWLLEQPSLFLQSHKETLSISLFRGAMQEASIILQVSSTNRLEELQKLLRQLNIIGTTSSNFILQHTFLTNALLNLKGQNDPFYKLNLLLNYQNGRFKYSGSDWVLSLQRTD